MRYVVNASEQPVELWACDGPRVTLVPGEQRQLPVAADCKTVSAEQFGALYRAPVPGARADSRRPSTLFTFLTGGSPQFPLAWHERNVVCFDNLSTEPAKLKLPGAEERHTVQSRDSMDSKLCFGGLTVDVVYEGVSPTKGDVRGYATVKESGLWVTSSQLRYDIGS